MVNVLGVLVMLNGLLKAPLFGARVVCADVRHKTFSSNQQDSIDEMGLAQLRTGHILVDSYIFQYIQCSYSISTLMV